MAYVNPLVQKEIETFINRRQQIVRPSKASKKKKSTASHASTNDKWKIHISNVIQRILQRKQLCLAKFSKLNTATSFRQFTSIKRKKIDRKKWYELDKKSKKTKTMLKYIRQEIRYHRRHQPVSLYRQQKRSSFEYKQKKIIGRKRNRIKMQRVSMLKKKFESNRDERKKLDPYKRTTTYGSHRSFGNISVVKNENRAKTKTKRPISSYCYISEAALISARSLGCENDKILLHYSNQRVSIYAIPVNHRKKPSKKYLINTFSTLSDIQVDYFDKQQPLPATTHQVKVKKQKSWTGERRAQATILMEPRHHDNIAQSEKSKKKKSKGQPKKNC
jgi:hypothetical protein